MRLLGIRQAVSVLRKAGFAHLSRSDADYGDSLILGAGEANLLELARAYTMVAALGRDRPLRVLRAHDLEYSGGTGGSSVGKSIAIRSKTALFQAQPLAFSTVSDTEALSGDDHGRLHSPGACYLIADILRDPGRLPFLEQLLQARKNAPVAFKTGTSFGLRDAWTAAYTPSHTVAVWFGREDGKPDQMLVGLAMAAPAAMKALRRVAPESGDGTWYAQPDDLGPVRVCSLSGAAASPWCPVTRTALCLTSVWRTVPCSLHIRRDGRTVLVWPPELEDYSHKRLAARDLSRAAQIVSPLPGGRYILTPGGRDQPLPMRAEGVAYPVHWYADGEYLGRQERSTVPLYWQPTHGEHTLSLLDAEERVASSLVRVTDLSAKALTERPLATQ